MLNFFQMGVSKQICQNCVYFENKPEIIEKEYPGLKIMSSAFASVIDRDGFCKYHQLYLSARDGCSNILLQST